jgi:hypothetical protein
MSISIDGLRVAVNLGAQRLQVGEDGQAVEDNRRTGLFSFRAKHAISADTRATADRIREALCRHYGRVRGESLFNKHIGAKGKDISSAKLRALLREGDGQIIGKADSQISAAMRSRILLSANAGAGVQAAETVLISLVRGGEVLSREPLNQPEISQTLVELRAEIAKLDVSLQELGDQPEELTSFAVQARIALQDLRARLLHQEGLLTARLASCPTTNANVGHAIGLMHDAAIRVVDDLMGQTTDRDNLERLAQLRDELLMRKEDALDPGLKPDDRADDERIKTLASTPGDLAKLIRRATSGMRFEPEPEGGLRRYSGTELGKMVARAHCEVLNAQQWTTVSRTMKIGVSGGQAEFVSDLCPATTLNPTLWSAYGGHGVCCHSTREAVHANNLVRSELKLAGHDQPVFKALRHGVHCAYGIGGRVTREAANDARVNELLVAALCDKPDLLARALSGECVTLPVTSVSLLTPDGWRKGSNNNETKYLREQTEAWQRASQGPRQLSIVGDDGRMHLITVQPRVLTFNFGVNVGAQGKLQAAGGGWGISTPMNTGALTALLGSTDTDAPIGGAVDAFLNSPGVTVQQARDILELTRQIKQLWNDKTYRESGKNPYLLPARILVLANMIGQTPAFNCKSGKDRTGQLDVEAKTLAARIQMLGRVPSLEESEDEDYKITREQLSINGGNHEIQRMNTGLAGFKTKGVSGLDAVYRGTGLKAAIGLSDHVHS